MATETLENEPPSEIQKFFSGKTVFLTGVTGFLGKLHLEKLLRSCKDLKRIYILLREKKGKPPSERFKEMLESRAFEVIKAEQPEFLSRVSILEGDLELPNLGLSDASQEIIKEEVDCIFAVGATVRFDETLRKAAYVNVRSTRDLLKIAKEMKHLESFIYVSTAFSNCTRESIDEEFYEPILGGHKFLDLVEILDDKALESIQTALLDGAPNTYVFSKAASEDIIRQESENLPIAIVRPSIVVNSYKEPLPGWLDTMYGPVSFFLGIAFGLIRSLMIRLDNVSDLVPADFVINATIAASWAVARDKHRSVTNATSEKGAAKLKIYNYVSRPQNPLTWRNYIDLSSVAARKVPSTLVVWRHGCSYVTNHYIHRMNVFLFQTVPSNIIDVFARCLGKKPIYVKIFKKIDKFCALLEYFTMNEWNFYNSNVQTLWNELNSTDKKVYNFDMGSFSWSEYITHHVVGTRIYLLKDPLETIPQGERKLRAVIIGHYVLVTVLCLLLYKFLSMIWNLLF